MNLMEFEVAVKVCQSDNWQFCSRGYNRFALYKACVTRRVDGIIGLDGSCLGTPCMSVCRTVRLRSKTIEAFDNNRSEENDP